MLKRYLSPEFSLCSSMKCNRWSANSPKKRNLCQWNVTRNLKLHSSLFGGKHQGKYQRTWQEKLLYSWSNQSLKLKIYDDVTFVPLQVFYFSVYIEQYLLKTYFMKRKRGKLAKFLWNEFLKEMRLERFDLFDGLPCSSPCRLASFDLDVTFSSCFSCIFNCSLW